MNRPLRVALLSLPAPPPVVASPGALLADRLDPPRAPVQRVVRETLERLAAAGRLLLQQLDPLDWLVDRPSCPPCDVLHVVADAAELALSSPLAGPHALATLAPKPPLIVLSPRPAHDASGRGDDALSADRRAAIASAVQLFGPGCVVVSGELVFRPHTFSTRREDPLLAFYGALVDGAPVDRALDAAHSAIDRQRDASWVRSGNGLLRLPFDDPADAARPAPPSTAHAATLANKRAAGRFDVFLCHNSADKAAVKRIGERLKRHGILPWLDEWELPPGQPALPQLERQLECIGSAAVFFGAAGIGPWQQQEMRVFVEEFVRRGAPLIPVLLDGAPALPTLPPFLRGMTWVDFRRVDPDPIRQLLWGITRQRTADG